MNWLEHLVEDESMWIYEIFIVLVITFSAALIASWFLNKLAEKTSKTKTLWDDALVFSLKKPIKWAIWLVGLSTAIEIAGALSSSALLDQVGRVRHLAIIFIGSWFLTGFISRAEQNVLDPEYIQKPMDKTTAVAIGKLLRISVIITSVLVALQSLGYSVSGILAFGGIGGIAVGFAAKDLLANFFGGLMIYLDRPFSVGDWVRSPDKNIEGVVEDIGWRLTRIRTFEKRPLYVPNSTFTQISVENPSRMSNRRIYETIGVRYDDAALMESLIDQIKLMLQTHEELDNTQTIIVNFNQFAPSSLDFFIYAYTKTTDWIKYHSVKQDVLLKVIRIIENSGAECAFPTSTIHVPNKVEVNPLTSEQSQATRENLDIQR